MSFGGELEDFVAADRFVGPSPQFESMGIALQEVVLPFHVAHPFGICGFISGGPFIVKRDADQAFVREFINSAVGLAELAIGCVEGTVGIIGRHVMFIVDLGREIRCEADCRLPLFFLPKSAGKIAMSHILDILIRVGNITANDDNGDD